MDKMTVFHYPISPQIAIEIIVECEFGDTTTINKDIHMPLTQEVVGVVKNCIQKLAENCVNEIYSNENKYLVEMCEEMCSKNMHG